MKYDIILTGVGGQGILSISAVIGYGALESGLHIKQSEIHGMSQRGGDVQSHLRISDGEIFSDLVPQGEADMILSLEPLESLRYLDSLSPSGWLLTNSTPVKNLSDYPDEKTIMETIARVPLHIALNADETAKKLGSTKSMNMVLAGAAGVLLPIDFARLEEGVRFLFGKKGEEIVEANIQALRAGREQAAKQKESRSGVQQ
jgi:indolepyruvate ferredoxin oxidoreductase, beta subunit